MRNYKIDILRGISILLVLLHHFNIPYKLHDTFLGVPVFGESLSTLIARNGNYGVTMFFVISGFLITQQTLQCGGGLTGIRIKDFYIRRIARILPCLVLLVIMVSGLGALGLQPFINQSPNGIEVSYGLTLLSAFGFWMNILIIKFGWVNYALGVLWSLSVEEVFYFAFPWLCVLLRRNNVLILFLLAIVIYAPYFRSLHFGEESGAYLYHYFSSFDGIAIGCLTALMAANIPYHAKAKPWLLVIIATLMVALYLYAPIKEVSTWSISVFALLTAILIYSFSQSQHSNEHQNFNQNQESHLAAHLFVPDSNLILTSEVSDIGLIPRILVWIGKRSYEMYLFHLIILGLMKVIYFPKETLPNEKLMLLIIYFLAIFILSWMIEKYYSTPLNLKLRKRFIHSNR